MTPTAWAVDRIHLTLGAGPVAALVGPNAAGKTTLLNLPASIIPPDKDAGQERLSSVRIAEKEGPGPTCPGEDGVVGQSLQLALDLAQHFVHENRICQAASAVGIAQPCINYRTTEGSEEIQIWRMAGALFSFIGGERG